MVFVSVGVAWDHSSNRLLPTPPSPQLLKGLGAGLLDRWYLTDALALVNQSAAVVQSWVGQLVAAGATAAQLVAIVDGINQARPSTGGAKRSTAKLSHMPELQEHG